MEPQQPLGKRRRLQSAAAQAGGGGATKVPKLSPAAVGQDDPNAVWLVVGLGNPGATYDNTRHNIGFAVLDALASAAGIDCSKLQKSAALGKGEIAGRQVYLAKPMTFMNNSGEAVAALARFYKIPSTHILVIADDLDLPLATVRLRQRGGHGGQNGLRSIIERLGNTQEFPRLKIGIGRPTGPMSPAAHVLQSFSKKEAEVVGVAVQEACDVVTLVCEKGLTAAMNRGGSQPKPGKEPRPPKKPRAPADAPAAGQAAAKKPATAAAAAPAAAAAAGGGIGTGKAA